MNRLIKSVVGVVLGLGALLAVGCSTGAGRYDVMVTPDAALKGEATPPTIVVDLIAVGGEEATNWRLMQVSKYWAPGSTIRSGKMDAIKEFKFGPGNMGAQTLSKDDKVWEAWKGADTLFVLARLPGGDDQAGELDSRRVIFPLARDRWDQDTLSVTLTRNRLVRVSEPKPETKK